MTDKCVRILVLEASKRLPTKKQASKQANREMCNRSKKCNSTSKVAMMKSYLHDQKRGFHQSLQSAAAKKETEDELEERKQSEPVV